MSRRWLFGGLALLGLLLAPEHRALAGDPAPCAGALEVPPQAMSVAWISPLRRRVSGQRWLVVMSTTSLRDWLVSEKEPTVGSLLQHAGIRKRDKEPKRRYKVTIFEVRSLELCRPVEGVEEGREVGGLLACPAGISHASGKYNGCGYATDLRDETRGPDVFRARWSELARRGFCVIPAERFVVEGAQR